MSPDSVRCFNPWRASKDVEKRQFLLFLLISESCASCRCLLSGSPTGSATCSIKSSHCGAWRVLCFCFCLSVCLSAYLPTCLSALSSFSCSTPSYSLFSASSRTRNDELRGTYVRLSHCRNFRLSGLAETNSTLTLPTPFLFLLLQSLFFFTHSLRSRILLLCFTLSGRRRSPFSGVRHRLSSRRCGSSPFGCSRLCRPACG